MKNKTKTCKILFTSIITLNLHFLLMLVLALFIALFNSYYLKNVLIWWIGFAIAIILLLAVISNILEITQNKIKKIFVFIGYWFFPLSIPYLVLDKDDENND
ncbi:hypothetical protein [Spiroplasma endosymbiont of Labia minor]|uniref:hypothetical protein n=1 Tax=Spiroplasma endosymbiont of Labia minor TaxID=3066305 RepID=UPI0030D48674